MGDEKIERKVEALKENEAVRRALEPTAGNKPAVKPKVEAGLKLGIGIYVLLLPGFAVFHYILRLEFLFINQ